MKDIFLDWFVNGFQKELNELFGPDQQVYVLLDNCRAHDLNGYADDPVTDFMKTYTLLDAINHVTEAWESISPELIQKCYENVIDHKLFLVKQEELHSRTASWKGLNFRGFEDTNEVKSIIKKKQKILERNRNTMVEL